MLIQKSFYTSFLCNESGNGRIVYRAFQQLFSSIFQIELRLRLATQTAVEPFCFCSFVSLYQNGVEDKELTAPQLMRMLKTSRR